MDQTMTVIGVEKDFIEVLEALSLRECRCNRRLRDKTKRVAELLAKVAEVRRDITKRTATEAGQAKGEMS